MKKLYIILFVSLVFITAVKAQHYDKFKLGIGVGYISGNADGNDMPSRDGGLFTLEPAYRVLDNFAVGLRLEAAVFLAGRHDIIPPFIASTTINSQYYFSDEQFRPFIGAGLGFFANFGVWFGFYPRIGFDWEHFTLALEFNLIPGALSNYDFITNTSSKSRAYYFSVKLGGFFFGGKN